jgi:hypothetical protein
MAVAACGLAAAFVLGTSGVAQAYTYTLRYGENQCPNGKYPNLGDTSHGSGVLQIGYGGTGNLYLQSDFPYTSTLKYHDMSFKPSTYAMWGTIGDWSTPYTVPYYPNWDCLTT